MSTHKLTLTLLVASLALAVFALSACDDETTEPDTTDSQVPESSMTHEGQDMTCPDPEGATVEETIILDTISECHYYRSTPSLNIIAHGGNAENHSGYLHLQIWNFTGEGTYTTTANEAEGTWVELMSGVGQDECNGGTWNEADLAPATGAGCTLEVTQSELETMELSESGAVETGRLQLTVTCDVLNDYGHGTTQSAALNVPGFTATFDIYDCNAGF